MKNNWEAIAISEICDSYAGGTPNRSNPKYYNGEIPWISSGEVNQAYITDTKEKITEEGLRFSSAKWIPNEAILLAMYGATAGQVSKLKIRATSNQAVLALMPYNADDYFIYYVLNFIKNRILYLAQGSGQPNLSKSLIDKTIINLPPLKQQKKIAKILSTVDKVIEKTESSIAKYQAIKQGLMHDLFTRGIDVNTGRLRPTPQEAPELYKESVLGLIPRDWDLENFEEATEIITDFTANGSFESLRVNVKYYYEINYGRLIRLTDLRQNLQTDGVYVNKSGFEFLLKSELRENDIMLANVGEYTGFACLMPKVNYPATIAPNMFLVRTDKQKFDSKFMYYFMTYPQFTTQVDNVSASSATKLLNKTNFRAMHIPKPKIEEQIQFGKKIESLDQKIQTEQQALAKYQQVKAGLLQDLLTGKVEVKT